MKPILLLIFLTQAACGQEISDQITVSGYDVVDKPASLTKRNTDITVSWEAVADIEWKNFRVALIPPGPLGSLKAKYSEVVDGTERKALVREVERGEKYNVEIEAFHSIPEQKIVAKSSDDIIIAPALVQILDFQRKSSENDESALVFFTIASKYDLAIFTIYDTSDFSKSITINSSHTGPVKFRKLAFGETYFVEGISESYGVNSTISRGNQTISIEPETPEILDAYYDTQTKVLTISLMASSSKRDHFHIISMSAADTHKINATHNATDVDIKGLTPGEAYNISIMAQSGSITSKASVYRHLIVIPPDAPTIINITAVDIYDRQMMFMPGEGSTEVFYVQASSALNASANRMISYIPPEKHKLCSVLFENLIPGMVYRMSVKAQSNKVNSTTAEYPLPIQIDPYAPRMVNYTTSNDTAQIVYEIKGITDSVTATISTVYSSSQSITVQHPQLQSRHIIQVSNLVMGAMYNVTFQSKVNSVMSLVSKVQSFVVAPSAPTITSMSQPSENSLEVRWQAGPGVASYFNLKLSDGAGSLIPLQVGKKLYTRVFDNLKPGKTYTITIYAVSNHKNSANAVATFVVAPEKPQFSIINVVKESFRVTWLEPITYSDAYHVYYQEFAGDMGVQTKTGLRPDRKKIKIIDLHAGMTYKVWMEAEAHGKSSGNTTEMLVSLIPYVPRQLTLMARAGGFYATWVQRGYAQKFEFLINQFNGDYEESWIYIPAVTEHKLGTLETQFSASYKRLTEGSYSVKMRAKSGDKDSGWSSAEDVTIAAMPVNVTTDLTALL